MLRKLSYGHFLVFYEIINMESKALTPNHLGISFCTRLETAPNTTPIEFPNKKNAPSGVFLFFISYLNNTLQDKTILYNCDFIWGDQEILGRNINLCFAILGNFGGTNHRFFIHQ